MNANVSVAVGENVAKSFSKEFACKHVGITSHVSQEMFMRFSAVRYILLP